MRKFDPSEHPVPFVHRLLLAGVAPRPIAFVGTLNADGTPNVSPFSYFNAFGANPPVIAISPAYRGTDGTAKHTFLNIKERGEFTVNAVTYSMVEQVSLASSNYEAGVNEFVKAGLTPIASTKVHPPRVGESPYALECKLLEHVELGGKPGSGNLLIGEIVMFHVKKSVMDGDTLDTQKLDLVARMGYNYYCRASGDAVFELQKPKHNGIGFDMLPNHMAHSPIYTNGDLARFAGVDALPDTKTIFALWIEELKSTAQASTDADSFHIELRAGNPERALHVLIHSIFDGASDISLLSISLQRCAQEFIRQGESAKAWDCALMAEPHTLQKFLHDLRS